MDLARNYLFKERKKSMDTLFTFPIKTQEICGVLDGKLQTLHILIFASQSN